MSELNNKPFKTKCNKVKHDWQDENGKLARRARKRICGCKLVGEKGIAWMVRIRITKKLGHALLSSASGARSDRNHFIVENLDQDQNSV